MNLNDLKFMAGSELVEMDQYTPEAKAEILDYIKEYASEEELINFVSEGYFGFGEELDESERVVNQQNKLARDKEIKRAATDRALQVANKTGSSTLGNAAGKAQAAAMRASDKASNLADRAAAEARIKANQAELAAKKIGTKIANSSVGKAAQKGIKQVQTDVQNMRDVATGNSSNNSAKRAGADRAQVSPTNWKNYDNPTTRTAAGIAVAGAGLLAAYKIYKSFFSKAARACSGKSGDEKKACMAQYRLRALRAQIAALTKAKSSCKGDAKCIAKLDAKITKLKAKM